MYMRAINDPFLERFFSRIPKDVAHSFSDDQLLAIKQAFADAAPREHSIDFRVSVPLPLRRFYLVLLVGPERRTKPRRRRERQVRSGTGLVGILFGLAILLIALLAVLGGLYLIKSALGIDLIPGFSLGFWTELVSQLKLMQH